jgi:hypothetical protein
MHLAALTDSQESIFTVFGTGDDLTESALSGCKLGISAGVPKLNQVRSVPFLMTRW